MVSSRCHLLADICQHYVALHHAKLSLINRDYGTVPAQMLATSAGFGVSGSYLRRRSAASVNKQTDRVSRCGRESGMSAAICFALTGVYHSPVAPARTRIRLRWWPPRQPAQQVAIQRGISHSKPDARADSTASRARSRGSPAAWPCASADKSATRSAPESRIRSSVATAKSAHTTSMPWTSQALGELRPKGWCRAHRWRLEQPALLLLLPEWLT
jgi:hypothetical protein